MDYEKAYNETLERAKAVYKKTRTDTAKGHLEEIFPELADSEDEKIRKFFIELITDNESIQLILKGRDIEINNALNYLEKQKDANKEYWRGYREGKQEILDKYAEIKKRKEREPADLDLDNASQDYVYNHFCSGADFTPEYIKGLMEDAFVNGANWHREQTDGKAMLHVAEKSYQIGYRDGKMEQKPDKCNGCNNIKGCINCVDGDQWAHITPEEYSEEKTEHEPFSCGHENGSSGKPNNQWSEEDERIVCNLTRYFKGEESLRYSEEKTISWLNSLRPQPHWKPSGQEKCALRTAIHILTNEKNLPKAAGHLQAILDSFEGKKSRKDWKPSEEQLDALKEASASWMNKEMGNSGLLESLYNDLKKLSL